MAPLVEQILHGLAGAPARHARFVEAKQLAALAAPLQSHGELVFVPPAHLEQITLGPRAEKLVIDQDSLTITGPDGATRQFGLDEHPALRGLADTLRATVGGDAALLARDFSLRASGDLGHWRLDMQPRPGAATGDLAEVVVQGGGADITAIELRQGNGDDTRLAISPTP